MTKTNKLKRLTMLGALMAAMLMTALPAGAQTLKLGKPVSGLYTSRGLTATTTEGVAKVVVLNDLEDHNWSYYSDATLPELLHSLSPADVKITYLGNGTSTVTAATAAEAVDHPTAFSSNASGVQVGPGATANALVYFKTLERENANGTGNLKYTTIPNPFQVRPTGNSGSVTPATRTVYVTGTSRGNNGRIQVSYTDANNTTQTWSSSGNGTTANTTITVKTGTTLTVTAQGRSGNWNYNYSTITAKYDDNNGSNIATVTCTNSNYNSGASASGSVNSQAITISEYRGFYAWRIAQKSASLTVTDVNGNAFAGGIIPAETEVRFSTTSSNNDDTIVFEALWAQAYVVTSNTATGLNSNVSYERNFVHLSANTTLREAALSVPVTYTTLDPATGSGTKRTITIRDGFVCDADTKFENLTFAQYNNNNQTITANNYDLIIGRGCSGTIFYVRGVDGGATGPSYNMRLESGTYTHLSLIKGYMTGGSTYEDNGSTMTGNIDIRCTLGCDYDRASNSGVTNNLTVTDNIIMGYNNTTANANKQRETTNLVIKSGKIGTSVNINSNTSYVADAHQSIYMSIAGNHRYVGRRIIVVEGGELIGIAGGIDAYYLGTGTSGNDVTGLSRIDKPSFEVRMTGGHIRGAVYGGAAKSPGSGNRRMIFTGGTVNGWIGCGCNGTEDAGGKTYGESFLYFGGNTRCEADPDHDYEMNGAKGGYVFGAGKGFAGGTGTSGEMTYGTNFAIADNSYIQRDAFGGGNYGYALDHTSLYVLGGTVGGNVFGGSNLKDGPTIAINTKGNGTVQGGLYGGSNAKGNVSSVTMNIGGSTFEGGVYGGGYGPNTESCDVSGNVNITMTGGTVLTGLYGGGNVRSVITGTTTVNVNGGTIGASGTPAGVYGGGLGQNTRANNSVTVNIGAQNANTGATIYGDVYGGSAKGVTNYTGSAANGSTAVTLNAGTIYGSLYGGGHGLDNANAHVYGAVTVTVNGGKVKPQAWDATNPASVFGCNNAAGSPQSTVSVTVNATDATTTDGGGNKVYAINGVYGGGNQAHYDYDNANYPTVTVNGCASSIKDVYGGGNAAAVPSTHVTINGGDIDRVFAGGNGESGTPAHVGYKNKTENSTTAPYTANGNTNVTVHGGTINQVFGGSNAHGTIKGSINVGVSNNSTGCPIAVHSLYSGGNKAPSALGTITVGCMNDGDMIDTLFCGANQADITGDVDFTMTGGRIGNLFGGNNITGNVSGSIALTVNWTTGNEACSNNYLGNVFGGGNLATFGTAGSPKAPTVNILNGTVSGNVYGGGKGTLVDGAQRGVAGKVTGNPEVNIGDDVAGHTATILGEVYGGGDAADVAGTPVIMVNDCNTSMGYLYGGGNAADVNGATITFNAGTVTGAAFGGGHGDKDASNPSKYADVNGDVTFDIYGGTLAKVFAGSNSRGTITGTSSLTVNKPGSCDMKIGELYGGGNEASGKASTLNIGCTGTLTANHTAHPENIGTTLEGIGYVYGGANQADIGASGAGNASNIAVNINSGIVGNVFGGNNTSGTIHGTITVNIEKNNSASCANNWYVGNVFGGGNLAQYTGAPAVNILNGTVSQNVYGGGKGDPNDHSKGQVTGNPVVTIGDATAGHEAYVAAVTGDVYGGGDAGNVAGTPVVNVINKCNTTIGNVYGGGNAADVTGTDVNIDGGTITGMVFGGGHGDKDATPQKQADVNGNVSVDITGGTIAKVFGGSNSKGNITGTVAVNINKDANSCEMHITEVYGGGNQAAGNAGTITIGCTGSATEGIGDVYGGAREADINSDITLNITGGQINNVFGGNNISGSIGGGITVNVVWDGSCQNSLQNVYGGGNLAQYTIPNNKALAVNILNGTVSQNVYGGGKGDPNDHTKGQVTGDPVVTIGDIAVGHESYVAYVGGDVYGGGDAGNVVGTPVVTIPNKANTSVGNVYGGGNAADVNGTDVTIYGGNISGMVFGGGHGDKDVTPQKQADVNGDVDVKVYGGTIAKVFGGSNSKGNISGSVAVTVDKSIAPGAADMKIGEVYGGGNFAAGNAGSITIGCTGTWTTTGEHNHTNANTTDNRIGYELEGVGTVYGGANQADIGATGAGNESNITVNINSGIVNSVFGGNNNSGTIHGTITVNIDKQSDACSWYVGNVYGGGNLAPYTAPDATPNYPAVNVKNGKVSHSVFGGGLGNPATVTGNPQVTLSGTAEVGENVYGGGDAAPVNGNTKVTLKN